MDTTNDFLTTQSLLTFAGATTATFVVPNALQRAFNFNPRWLALVIAQVICFALVYRAHETADPSALKPITDYLIAFVNGCLVFCSAAGATNMVSATTGSTSTPTQAVARSSTGSSGDGREAAESDLPRRSATHNRDCRRYFFTSWF